jgi:predicted alpha/beta hydrolase
VAVLSHAMFARRTEFERPAGGGLAPFLADRGWRTIAFDFRGHGDSGPSASSGGVWGYDDLIQRDLPAVVACARARAKRLPVVVFGHSLGGNAALAAQGAGLLEADAVVAIAANVWMREQEPSRTRWAAKRALMVLVEGISRRRGYFPARALRLGSDDESARFMSALVRFAREGAWTSEDHTLDYAAARSKVTIPVLAMASHGDRLNCNPACAERMIGATRGPREFVCVGRADGGGPAPDHMGLVTSGTAMTAWQRAAEWIEGALCVRPPLRPHRSTITEH